MLSRQKVSEVRKYTWAHLKFSRAEMEIDCFGAFCQRFKFYQEIICSTGNEKDNEGNDVKEKLFGLFRSQ